MNGGMWLSKVGIRAIRPVQQRRFARVGEVRWIQSQSRDVVLARYRDKLEEKAKSVGAKDVEELKEQFKDKIEETKKSLNNVDVLKELEEFESNQEKKSSKTIKVNTPRPPVKKESPYKTLDSFIDVEKMQQLSTKEIELIWRMRFQDKEGTLHAALSDEAYDRLAANARTNPSFILPLPRDGDGYEMHFVQWSFVGQHTTHCMITTVAEFKLHKEFAVPHTTLMFHSELKKGSGLVLMNGKLQEDSNVNLTESQLLVMNVQRFYGGLGESESTQRKLKLLRDFTQGNPEFSMDELINEAGSME